MKSTFEIKLEIAANILNGFISYNYNTGIPKDETKNLYVKESVKFADMLYKEMVDFQEKNK